MRSSLFISILSLLISGCVSVKPSHISPSASQVQDPGFHVTRYAPPVTSHLFKATLDIKKHHLTGLMVIKRMETAPPVTTSEDRGETPPPAPPQKGRGDCSGNYRIVFMNEIGMTFFDLEMSTDSFKVVSCFESLNKKALIRIFETDFRMLISTDMVNNGKEYQQSGTRNKVVSAKSGKYKTWQTYSPAGDTLFTTAAKSNIADPVIITYDRYKDGFPIKITIENPFIGMKLSLRKLVQ